MFNHSKNIIGLKPAHRGHLNAVMTRARHPRSNRVVRAMAFLREHDIRLDRTVLFPYAKIDDGIIILDLTTRINAGKRAWKPGRWRK